MSLYLVLWRLPDLIASLFAAIVSGSMVTWMEFVECSSIIVPGIIIFFLTKMLKKNLKFKFNYGTGKVEAITALSCEIFDIAGLLCIIVISVKDLISPEAGEGMYFVAALTMFFAIVVDLYFFRKQKKLVAESHGRIFHTAYFSANKELVFDIIAFLTLIVEFLLKGTTWGEYISPIVCILVAIPFIVILIRNMSYSVSELSDVTLDEESQLEILSILARYYDEYSVLGEVRSRKTGELVFVDIELSFENDTTYEQMRETAIKIHDDISENFSHCVINIVLKLYGQQ